MCIIDCRMFAFFQCLFIMKIILILYKKFDICPMFYSGASGEFSGRVSRYGWDRYEKNCQWKKSNKDAFSHASEDSSRVDRRKNGGDHVIKTGGKRTLVNPINYRCRRVTSLYVPDKFFLDRKISLRFRSIYFNNTE